MKLKEREQTIKDLQEIVDNYSGSWKRFNVLDNALSLIKELTEENEKLLNELEGAPLNNTEYEVLYKGKCEETESLKQAMEHEHASFMEIFGQWSEKCDKLAEENERLKKHAISYETPLEKQTIPNLCSLEGAAAVLYLQIENQIKSDTVRKMHSEIEARCIKGGIYPAFVKSTIDQIAKEMIGEKND